MQGRITMSYDNTNKGVLFNNDRKQNDKHPDKTGKLNIGGVDYYISAWNKTGAKGEFLSLSVTEAKKEVDAHNTAKANAYQPQVDLEESIPF